MRNALGGLMLVVGAVLGLFGDYPINMESYSSWPLMVAGGLLVAAGLATLLLTAGQRGGREDEPSGHIRP